MVNQLIGRAPSGFAPSSDPPRQSLAVLQRHLRWRRWRINRPEEPRMLTSAELSECCCPDLCHRDHDND